MILTHRNRLLPHKSQHRALERLLHAQRELYNAALEERIDSPLLTPDTDENALGVIHAECLRHRGRYVLNGRTQEAARHMTVVHNWSITRFARWMGITQRVRDCLYCMKGSSY